MQLDGWSDSIDSVIDIEKRETELEAFIDSQFADLRNIPYHLYAVFMHHGSVEFGHYYIYIFDFEKSIWRKYNDSYVTEVHNTAEIFDNRSIRNPPTPYFVVYVHDRMRARVAQPVCRAVIEEPSLPASRGSDMEITEISQSRHHESRMSSPGTHTRVAGNENTMPDAHASGVSAAAEGGAWNAGFADRKDVRW
jgi:ubiquitin carboxyl-terminal hydrolase 25/28